MNDPFRPSTVYARRRPIDPQNRDDDGRIQKRRRTTDSRQRAARHVQAETTLAFEFDGGSSASTLRPRERLATRAAEEVGPPDEPAIERIGELEDVIRPTEDSDRDGRVGEEDAEAFVVGPFAAERRDRFV